VGIAVDNAYNIVEFAITYKINYPLLVGGATALGVARALGNAGGGLPYTVALDRSGAIAGASLAR
jgi:hypothetical protein